MSIIIFIIILAVLIFVHELGHFIAAKRSGIRVDEFGLGFPPKLFSRQIGETLYTVNAIPFGGFVKIFGEDPHTEIVNEEDKKRSFYWKPKWIQAIVLVAGVTFNVIFAWLVISLGLVIGLPSPEGYSGYGQVRDSRLVITQVLEDSPAKKAGLTAGDQIVSASAGMKVVSGEDLTPDNIRTLITESNTKRIELSYKRGEDVTNVVSVEPNVEIGDGRRAIGIAMESVGILKLPVHLALIEGAKLTISITKATAIGLFDFVAGIFTLESDLSQVSGPVGIAGVVGEARTLGFVYLLTLTALISINLAIINLLPFPALDGGRLLFVLIEVIIRRPISVKFVRIANAVGFVFLISLMLFVTAHDILKLL